MAIEHMIANIQAEIGNLPKAVIKRELLKAARDFCEEVDVVLESIPVTFAAGEDLKSISQPSELSTLRIVEVEELKRNKYTQPSRTEIALLSAANSALSLTLTVACRPSSGSVALPEALNVWDKALEAKTLFQLFKKPNKAWTDLGQAAFYQSEYDSEVFRAKQLSANGHTSAPRRVPLRKFV